MHTDPFFVSVHFKRIEIDTFESSIERGFEYG